MFPNIAGIIHYLAQLCKSRNKRDRLGEITVRNESGLTRAVSLRRCTKHGKDVRPRDVCECWAMSEQLQLAGRTQGRVKRKEYLMYLVAVREEDTSAEQMGLKIKAKSIAQVRAEFEREHGSIYVNI